MGFLSLLVMAESALKYQLDLDNGTNHLKVIVNYLIQLVSGQDIAVMLFTSSIK
jgi:hypothetical protein|tara:strand:+ start:241 stop:402 length:162 start_codon:yes stop_codon:yes gene_type:complete